MSETPELDPQSEYNRGYDAAVEWLRGGERQKKAGFLRDLFVARCCAGLVTTPGDIAAASAAFDEIETCIGVNRHPT